MTDTKYVMDGATPDPSLLAHMILEIDEELAALGRRREILVAALVEIMPKKRMELPGLPPFERMKSSNRKKWQTPELVSHMVTEARKRAVTEDGEIIPADERLAQLIQSCAYIGYWRKEPLELLGLQVDEWCETTPGKSTIRFYGTGESK